MRRVTIVLLASAAFSLAVDVDAFAAFPGQNGKIAYTGSGAGGDVWVANPDGTGQQQLTSSPAIDGEAAWSADGTKIAFTSNRDGNAEIYVMNGDGSNQVRLTNNPAADMQPTWSPDGTKIAFESERDVPPPPFNRPRSEIYVMNADGSAQTRVTNYNFNDQQPSWSPDGSRIAFSTQRGPAPACCTPPDEIWTMRPDGSDLKRITASGGCLRPDEYYDFEPNWSPDGRRIAFSRASGFACGDGDEVYEVMTVRADGTEPVHFTPWVWETQPAWSPDGTKIATDAGVRNLDGTYSSDSSGGAEPDWQPLPVNTPSTHAGPKAATPTYLPLVPAYDDCTAPNRQHGGGLAFGTCAPPNHLSPTLTVGVGDGSPAFSRSVGFVRLKALPGTAGAPDDADMAIRLSLTNVMRKSDLSDYTGELGLDLSLKLTDHEGAVSQTTMGFGLSATAPCSATASTIDGATCDVNTTVEALIPNAITEGARAIFELGQVKVRDGGPDEDADTPAGDGVLATQGVFVP